MFNMYQHHIQEWSLTGDGKVGKKPDCLDGVIDLGSPGELYKVGLMIGDWLHAVIGERKIGVWLHEETGVGWYEETGDMTGVRQFIWDADADPGDLANDILEGTMLMLILRQDDKGQN